MSWSVRARAALVSLAVLVTTGVVVIPAQAAVTPGVTPLGWNVVGLDSNNVNAGPNLFPMGARLCTDANALTGVTATWTWADSDASAITLEASNLDSNTITLGDIAADSCSDAYWNVKIIRSANSYEQLRNFSISFSDSGAVNRGSLDNRKVYVEKLVSQNRNEVTGLQLLGGGPLVANTTRTFTVSGKTSTAYPSLVFATAFPDTYFQLLKTEYTYSNPGGSADQVFADTCGWVYTTNPGSCSVARPAGAGGTISATFTVRVHRTPDAAFDLPTLIYDFSGSSFHYNTDYATSGAAYRYTPAPTITVTYNGNGATGGFAPTTATGLVSGANYTVASNTGATPLTLTGSTFVGWNTEANGSGQTYLPGDVINPTSNLTLWAIWRLTADYIVMYLGNGATSGGVTPQSVTSGGSVNLRSNDPGYSRPGYIFSGWNLLANGTGTNYAEGDPLTPTGDVTLYAKWTVSITYDANYSGGPNDYNDAPATAFTSSTYYSVLGLPTVNTNADPDWPIRTGYNFLGWNTAENGSGTSFPAGANFVGTSLTTLYAQWAGQSSTYVLTYNANGGSGTAPATELWATTDPAHTLGSSNNIYLPGYVFVGWTVGPSGTLRSPGSTYTPTGDTTFYAQWQRVYNLTINIVGSGSVNAYSGLRFAGEIVTITPTPQTGWVFLGWTGSCTGTGTCTVTMNQSHTVTAVFGPAQPPAPPVQSNTPQSPININGGTTTGQTPLPINLPSGPPGSQLIVANNLMPTYPGIQSATINNGVLTYVADPGFSGKTFVPLALIEDGKITYILVPITVNPVAPKEGTYTPLAKNDSVLRWEPSPNAKTYDVYVNKDLTCKDVVKPECSVKQILGPKALVEVVAKGNDSTRSFVLPINYKPERLIPYFVINFDEDKYVLKPQAIRVLNDFVKMMKAQGFPTVVIEGHTDGQGGAKNARNLSNQRAVATANYLKRFIKVEFAKIPAGEKRPVATNATSKGQATNRRATGAVK